MYCTTRAGEHQKQKHYPAKTSIGTPQPPYLPSTDIINITKRGVSLPVRTHPQHIKFIAVSTYMYLNRNTTKTSKPLPTITSNSTLYTTAQRSIHCSRETFSTNNNAAGFAAMYFIIRNLIDNFVLPTFSGYSISALFSTYYACDYK